MGRRRQVSHEGVLSRKTFDNVLRYYRRRAVSGRDYIRQFWPELVSAIEQQSWTMKLTSARITKFSSNAYLEGSFGGMKAA